MRTSVDPRAAVRSAVEKFLPRDDRTTKSKETFLRLFDGLDNPFSRESDPTHVTAGAFITGPQGVLLHKHRRLGIWLQPGGHLEEGETPEEAARREALEETGLVLDGAARFIHLDVHPCFDHIHLDLRYQFDGVVGAPVPPPGESQDVEWFPLADAPDQVDEITRNSLRYLG